MRSSTQVEINVVCIFQQIFKICNLAARIIKSLQAYGQRQDSTQVEIKLYFDSNKTFMKYIISSENFERLDMVYDSLVLCCEFSNDFEGELVLPSDIKEYE